ncbi:MAG: outer membrane beta-barrel protein [Ignavibacteriaceae bacterium]|nr:outer membrane beta-barrel protein [Ignavibacteriaceae bacterium]
MKKFFLGLFLTLLFAAPLTNAQFSSILGMKFGVNGGLGMPVGLTSDLVGPGPGFMASFEITPPLSPLAIGVTAGYYSFGFSDDLFKIAAEVAGKSSYTIGKKEGGLSMIPVQAYAKYYLVPGPVKPYAELAVGIASFSIDSIKSINFDANNVATMTLADKKSETKYLGSLGVGLEITIPLVITFDVNAKIHTSGLEVTTTKVSSGPNGIVIEESKENAMFFTIGAGVKFNF